MYVLLIEDNQNIIDGLKYSLEQEDYKVFICTNVADTIEFLKENKSVDIAIIDLYQGTIEMMKSGACPTYIKHNKKVQLIKSASLPAGIVEQNNLQVFDRDIEAGEILLMCTDGILDSNIEYKNKELWVKYLLEDIETNNTKKIADLVLNEAIDNNFGKAKDDMSVIVCKFLEKDEK